MKNNLPSELFNDIFERIQVGLTYVNKEGEVIFFNPAAAELLGWDNNDFKTKTILDCHPPWIKHNVSAKLNLQIPSKMWHKVIKVNGRYIENIYSPVFIPGKVEGIAILTMDVTEREEKTKLIENESLTDAMTGLYNRRFFNKLMYDYLTNSKPFGIIMLDVNGLKYVNDTFGHEQGDALIIEAAEKISKNIRRSDYVFRYGGDEFLVFVPGGDIQELEQISSRIKSVNLLPTAEKPVVLNLSIGSCSSHEVANAEEVVCYADKRMYEDKCQFYRHR